MSDLWQWKRFFCLFFNSLTVLATLDSSYGVSANQMQCRIAPFIPAIQESAALYDLVFKLMKALHTSMMINE